MDRTAAASEIEAGLEQVEGELHDLGGQVSTSLVGHLERARAEVLFVLASVAG